MILRPRFIFWYIQETRVKHVLENLELRFSMDSWAFFSTPCRAPSYHVTLGTLVGPRTFLETEYSQLDMVVNFSPCVAETYKRSIKAKTTVISDRALFQQFRFVVIPSRLGVTCADDTEFQKMLWEEKLLVCKFVKHTCARTASLRSSTPSILLIKIDK